MELVNELDYGPILETLFHDLDKLPATWTNLEDAHISIYKKICEYFHQFLTHQPPSEQQNETYKNALFNSLENLILAVLHNKVFSFICKQMREEDNLIYTKCVDLSTLKVTPDQLGALEDYSIPLPASIVELASLDMHETPTEKFTCLSTTFDLAMAELKGAIADVYTVNCDNKIPTLNNSDITPILTTVIIHARPIHFISNFYYIENFRWSELSDTESECMLAFRTAIDKLKVVTADVLLPRSTRIYCDIGLEDLFYLTASNDNKYDRKGQRTCGPVNPLERHIEHFTHMITKSTLEGQII